MTGWRAVRAVMQEPGLNGTHASRKGLRHGFGVAAVSAGIPLNKLQEMARPPRGIAFGIALASESVLARFEGNGF
jgi:hypothetical protein